MIALNREAWILTGPPWAVAGGVAAGVAAAGVDLGFTRTATAAGFMTLTASRSGLL